MTDLAALLPGTVLCSKGENVYGDSRILGMLIRSQPTDDGEPAVVILTNSPRKPRQPSLKLCHEDNRHRIRYENLGLVARLERLLVCDIDPTATPTDRVAEKVRKYARYALMAAALPPNDHIGTKGHDDLISAYRILRDEAILLGRGVG